MVAPTPAAASSTLPAVYPSSTSEWISPEGRPEDIAELISGVDRYNPSNLPILEDYLYEQVRSGSYDALANLATLKLYQFNPSLLNPDVLINLLLKALVATPGPDFGLAMAIVGDRANSAPMSDDEDDVDSQLPILLPFLTKLHTLLRTCQYSEFWKTLDGKDEAAVALRQRHLAEHDLFPSLIRTNIVARAIASTHTRIPLALCSKWTNLSASELASFVEEQGWKIEGESVTIPVNEDNGVKGKTVRENVELSQLQKIIAAGGN